MPSLTAADMASRTMKKGWVNRTEADDSEDARENAATATGRAAGVARLAVNRERRRSPLYERRVNNKEEGEALDDELSKDRKNLMREGEKAERVLYGRRSGDKED